MINVSKPSGRASFPERPSDDGALIDRKLAEEALHESEERYRHLVEALPAAIYMCDARGRVTLYNQAAAALWGREPELGKDLWCGSWHIYRPDGTPLPLDECPMAVTIREGRPIRGEEIVIERPDGTRRNVLPHPEPILDATGTVVGAINMLVDVTDRKRSEEIHARLAAIIDSSDDAIVGKTLQGIITSWNRGAERIFGFTEAEAVGKHISMVIPVERRAEEDDVLGRLLRGEKIDHLETERRAKDGRKISISLTVSPIKDAHGHIIGASKVARDITQRKRTETTLQETRTRLQAVVSNAPILLFSLDDGGTITFADGKGLAADLAPHAMLGRSIHDVFRTGPWMVTDIERALQGASLTNTGAVAAQWLELHCTPLRNETGLVAGVIGVLSDVTEKKRMEDELVKASKLESIGVLAGGIAHDFNNVLAAIIGNLALAKMYVEPGHKAFNRLTESEKAVLRAQSLTQQLLTFSRGGAPIKEAFDIGPLLEEWAAFGLQGSNVRCEVLVPDELWPIDADEGQMNQVINNLVLNAKQAMPQGGVLRITAANTVINADQGLPFSAGRYLHIRVKDEGEGIPPEHVSKIFDPFFTTKPKGSGLGLTSSYWIVKRHGGHLAVDSILGEGTTVSIFLPASEHRSPAPREAETRRPGQGRVLFMDDEAPVRDFARELLNHLGYGVECVRDGAEAVERFRKARDASQPFTVVILDLTVRAGMGGREAIDHLRRIDPHVKAIVSSGYSNDPILANFRAFGFSERLAKPYTPETFSKILAELAKPVADG